MCVLCGEFILQTHWSDSIPQKDDNTIVVGSKQHEWVKKRIQRVEILNKILSFYGLNIKDWNTSKYTLFDKKGNCVIVDSLGDLWEKAYKLSGHKMDALDEKLVQYLKDKK